MLAKLAVLKEENSKLRMENAQLRPENAELRRRLDMNSGNSHKPPSSDGYKKKKIVALPKHVGRVWQDNYMGLIWFVISHGVIFLCISKGGKRH
ncbi:DUF6444 domain-containing protein [Thermoflexibacter ruber]|uniref:DUF6444 domain-containing protein n=1 Tax=Thermoflexibacter ruber TaxID=1003 RepID=UPI0015A6B261